MIFAPGSNARIEWTFFTKKPLEKRTWYFTSTDGTFDEAELAIIHGMDEPIISNSGLTGVSVEGNATLVLKNVNQSYDGTYLFILSAGPSTDRSPVIVTIAGKGPFIIYGRGWAGNIYHKPKRNFLIPLI